MQTTVFDFFLQKEKPIFNDCTIEDVKNYLEETFGLQFIKDKRFENTYVIPLGKNKSYSIHGMGKYYTGDKCVFCDYSYKNGGAGLGATTMDELIGNMKRYVDLTEL